MVSRCSPNTVSSLLDPSSCGVRSCTCWGAVCVLLSCRPNRGSRVLSGVLCATVVYTSPPVFFWARAQGVVVCPPPLFETTILLARSLRASGAWRVDACGPASLVLFSCFHHHHSLPTRLRTFVTFDYSCIFLMDSVRGVLRCSLVLSSL